MQYKPHKKRVLIADDAHETRRNTRLMLAMVEEVEVVAIALDGTQAIEMAAKQKPDIVILDLHMPRVNGITAYKKIIQADPHIAGIIISAEKDPKAINEAKSLGIHHYLLKPFTADELENAVRDLVHVLDQNVKTASEVRVPGGEKEEQLRQLAEEFIQTKRTDEEAVKIFEEAVKLPNCEIRWVQTLAMIYVVRLRWGKLRLLAENMEKKK